MASIDGRVLSKQNESLVPKNYRSLSIVQMKLCHSAVVVNVGENKKQTKSDINYLQRGGENKLHGGSRSLGHAENVEVPHEAGSDLASSAPGRGRPGDEHRISYLFPKQLITVVETLGTTYHRSGRKQSST